MNLPPLTSDPDIRSNAILRRYLDLPKFLDLLHSKSLYFRRADGFADRLEGALFPSLRGLLDEEHQKGNIHLNANDFYKAARESNYVNCWTIGAKDNMALWSLFGGSKSSIVITSTLDRLMNTAANFNEPVHAHKVKYVNHKNPPDYAIGMPREVLQYKNEAFKFESELRLIVTPASVSDSKMGIRLPVGNLSHLIRSVVVSPEAEPGYIDTIKDLCKKYGLSSPVRASSLAHIPI